MICINFLKKKIILICKYFKNPGWKIERALSILLNSFEKFLVVKFKEMITERVGNTI